MEAGISSFRRGLDINNQTYHPVAFMGECEIPRYEVFRTCIIYFGYTIFRNVSCVVL